MAAEGKAFNARVIEDAGYADALRTKIGEELAEYRASGDIEDLADIVEIIAAILTRAGMDWATFEALRDAKRDTRGGFARRWCLTWTTP